MRLVMVLFVAAVMGCASSPEMRPRGKRNSVRIEALEKRIASLERQIEAMAATNRSMLSAMEAMNRPHALEPAPVAPTPPAPAPGP